MRPVAKKRYQAVGFPCNRMLKLSSSRGIMIDIPVLSVSWSFENHSVIIKALREGLIEHEASDTGGVPRWQSSCPDSGRCYSAGMISSINRLVRPNGYASENTNIIRAGASRILRWDHTVGLENRSRLI